MKTKEQVAYIKQIYNTYGITDDCKVSRAAAVKYTGLKWRQIYKWMYDFHELEKNGRRKPAKIFDIIKVPRAKKP